MSNTRTFIQRVFDGYYGIYILGMALIILTFIFPSASAYHRAKQELSAAKRYYLSQIDNENTATPSNGKIADKISENFGAFASLGFQASEVKLVIDEESDFSGSSQINSSLGYYGRPITVRLERQIQFFFNEQPFTISVGVTTVNRTTLNPSDKYSVEYRLGKEFE